MRPKILQFCIMMEQKQAFLHVICILSHYEILTVIITVKILKIHPTTLNNLNKGNEH